MIFAVIDSLNCSFQSLSHSEIDAIIEWHNSSDREIRIIDINFWTDSCADQCCLFFPLHEKLYYTMRRGLPYKSPVRDAIDSIVVDEITAVPECLRWGISGPKAWCLPCNCTFPICTRHMMFEQLCEPTSQSWILLHWYILIHSRYTISMQMFKSFSLSIHLKIDCSTDSAMLVCLIGFCLVVYMLYTYI